MNIYKNKYLKYKTKYFNLQYQLGGTNPNPIKVIKDKTIFWGTHGTYGEINDDGTYNKDIDYFQINNSGQQNCGIFISKKYSELLIKCENYKKYNEENFNKFIKKLNDINKLEYFPQIKEFFYDETASKKYIKMEKLDGDLTQLLYEKIPLQILNKMNLDNNEAKNIYNFFHLLRPYNMIFYYSDIGLYIYNNNEEIIKEKIYNFIIKQIKNDNKKSGYTYKINDIQNNKDYVIYIDISNISLSIEDNNNELKKNISDAINNWKIQTDNINSDKQKILDLFIINKSNSIFNIKNLNIFLSNYKIEFENNINIFRNEILKLEKKLIEKNHIYEDIKLDNFGYKDNKKGERKYYILDWSSGLFLLNDTKIKKDQCKLIQKSLIDNLSIYGQMHYYDIFSKQTFMDIQKLINLKDINGENITENLISFFNIALETILWEPQWEIKPKWKHNCENYI
jgi:hypothetical protein